MTVVQISTAPSRAMYDEVSKHVDLDNRRPDGLLAHAASELPDGSVQIVDIYESAEALEAFGRERMIPAFQTAGVLDMVMSQGQPVAHDGFHVVA
jgi:hypothetical protein